MNISNILIVLGLASGMANLAYGLDPASSTAKPQATTTGAGTSFTCGNGLPPVTITFGASVPTDLANFTNQSIADCFAWSEFIALNWPSNGADFGAPGDTSPVQWETYMDAGLLFNKNGTAPPPWGTQPSIPTNCGQQAGLSAAAMQKTRLFTATSKFDPNFSFEEAAPPNAPNWLGAQNSTVVWYEIHVNQDEYNYVNQNGLYNANTQSTFVNNGNGSPIVLVKGTTSGTTGAIELKAAWMEAPDFGSNPKWNRFKVTSGVVVDPATQQCRQITLALVGLHIIHKTTSQPTWLWATFEQVDNVFTPGGSAPATGYNFYNPNCASRKVSAPTACVPNSTASGNTDVTVGCTPNVSPPYYLGSGCPGPVPIQVTRVTQLDQNALTANSLVQSQIRQNFPNSVWQYYQLVDVLWSTNPTQDPSKPIQVPHPVTSMTSGNGGLVANTTLETYAQTKTCTSCHVYGAIATGTWSSDFSFLFSTAGPEANNLLRTKRLLQLKQAK